MTQLNNNSLYQIVEYRDGRAFINPNDYYIGQALAEYGEYCQGEIDLFAQIVQPGDIVFEVGANIGSHSVWLAKRVGSGGRLYAFEPQRLIFQMLCANVVLNDLSNVRCVNAGLGKVADTVYVQELEPKLINNFGAFSLLDRAGQAGESTEIKTLNEYDAPSCKFLKIDVEGMERDVIAGGSQFIKLHRPVIYVENDRPAFAKELTTLIDSLGYKMFWHAVPLFNPNNYRLKKENIFMKKDGLLETSMNMICIHVSDQRFSLHNHFTQVFPGEQFKPPSNFKT